MVDKNNGYSGPERRDDCATHCGFAAMAKSSVPRVYFLSSLSTMVLIALAFAGWYVASLNTFKAEQEIALERLSVAIHADMAAHKKQMDMRIVDTSDKYTQDVERFIRATGEIRTAISQLSRDVNEMKVDVGKIKVTQDVVVKKLNIK